MTRIALVALLMTASAAVAFFPEVRGEPELNPIARGSRCGIILTWDPTAPNGVELQELRLGARLRACRMSERQAVEAAALKAGQLARP